MNKSQVTRILNKANKLQNDDATYSLGFCRWAALSNNNTLALAKQFYKTYGTESDPEFYQCTKDFLDQLSNDEFKDWLTNSFPVFKPLKIIKHK